MHLIIEKSWEGRINCKQEEQKDGWLGVDRTFPYVMDPMGEFY